MNDKDFEQLQRYCAQREAEVDAELDLGFTLIDKSVKLTGYELRELLEAHARGDVARAAALHLSVTPLLRSLFETSSPIPVKWAMGQLGFRAG